LLVSVIISVVVGVLTVAPFSGEPITTVIGGSLFGALYLASSTLVVQRFAGASHFLGMMVATYTTKVGIVLILLDAGVISSAEWVFAMAASAVTYSVFLMARTRPSKA
jgi:hypothetical protein